MFELETRLDEIKYNIYNILDEVKFVSKGKYKLSNVPSVFDIETTSFYVDNEKHATMYAWVLGINGKCMIGRTWGEFLHSIDVIINEYKISLKKRFVIYIHNLSYEFQFIRHYFEWEKVFCLKDRKPIYALTKDGIEFRCSYLLSGYSLEKLGENLTKYKVDKKVGDLDYSLKRHSTTPLTNKELGYILNDGLVVMAHIQEEIERLGNISKIPLTKTGYVRNLCRNNCIKHDKSYKYKKLIKNLQLTPQSYKQLKRVFTGGFTHANINYVDKIINNVSSFDFTSSYPAVMIAEKFPMSIPHKTIINSRKEFNYYLNNYCCVFSCTFYNISSCVEYENYISLSKCNMIENEVVNNGRIVEADKLNIILTEQDFFIIQEMYEWDYFEIGDFTFFFKDYLPKDFINTILTLYKDKTELKDVEGKEVEYMVSKSMLNALFGMAVTDICRDEIIYNKDWSIEKVNINEAIEEYNNDKKRFLYYAWGVWITAYAKRNLFTGITEFKNDYIYSDTDSIKVVNKDNHIEYINKYNEDITKKIEGCLKHYDIDIDLARPKNKKGIEKPLGVWEYEGTYDRFKTLGAKRYITEKDKKLSITIAGVSKKDGLRYLLNKYKTNTGVFEAFKEGLYFPATYDNNGVEENGSGKLCHTYIDYEQQGYMVDYTGKVGEYHELSSVHLENTDYTMSLDADFIKLILGVVQDHII